MTFYPDIKKRNRRKKTIQQSFPDNFVAILEKQLPFYASLPEKLRLLLHQKILAFLDEVRFEGCGDLTITDEIRLTIAGQASMLLLNDQDSYFNILQVVLVYPSAYVAKTANPDGTFEESVRLGESWVSGTVVLAWDDVLHGIQNTNDGQDVVLHEFAHQLDQESGSGNGAPVLKGRTSYASWAKVLGREYKELKKRSENFKKTLLDSYGATNPAEFFAVATETFFEKPEKMKEKHPELYAELKKYYNLDPCDFF
ncbi:MAG: zinc-dependent peptidase [Candidatus Riflebacteria bacterium]|nr:zinc-dependent peptidase [Candidatus Riflebacteria bacterium]